MRTISLFKSLVNINNFNVDLRMKKIFIILLLAGSSLTAFSQKHGDLQWGIHAGPNASTAQSGSNTNSNSRYGFNAGVSADYFLSERFSLKANLSYDQKGWDNGFIAVGSSIGQTNYHYDYLTVPVMATWHWGSNRNWHVGLGPYAGYLISAHETAFDTDLKSLSESIDAGLAFAIGVKIPVAKKLKILIEADGQAGLTDVVKNNSADAINHTRTSLNTGLVFGF